jgi:hypothetical protein
MNRFPFQNVLRRNAIELRLDDLNAASVFPGELILIDSDANEEVLFEHVLKRGLRVASMLICRATGQQSRHGKSHQSKGN